MRRLLTWFLGWTLGLRWRVELLAAKHACRLLDRHRNGSPAWLPLGASKVAGFRDRPVFVCKHCGAVAFNDNEPRRLVDLGRRHFGGGK